MQLADFLVCLYRQHGANSFYVPANPNPLAQIYIDAGEHTEHYIWLAEQSYIKRVGSSTTGAGVQSQILKLTDAGIRKAESLVQEGF